MVRVQETDKYKSTLLRTACQSQCQEEVIRFLLSAYPEGAFVMARDKKLPLQGLFGTPGYFSTEKKLSENKNSIAMVALANPNAIFSQTYNKRTDPAVFSPFTTIATGQFLGRYDEEGSAAWRAEPDGSEHAILWSFLFLLLSIYRYGDKINVTEAWCPPQYPAHMGKYYNTIVGTFVTNGLQYVLTAYPSHRQSQIDR